MDINAVSDAWDQFTLDHYGKKLGIHWWQAGKELRKYINFNCSGEENITWYEHAVAKIFKDRTPLDKCLSLGCGRGFLERELHKLNAFIHCDAYDVSGESIKRAMIQAEESSITNIRYQILDVNRMDLPENSYDAVWISGAMHHFAKLEHICNEIKKSLKPDGFLLLNEYIGPNRFQFPERQKEIINNCLKLIPEEFRVKIIPHSGNEKTSMRWKKGYIWYIRRMADKIKDRDLLATIQRRMVARKLKGQGELEILTHVNFPSERDIIAGDPSEAIRSQDIIRVISEKFEIIEKHDWGGNIFQFALRDIAGNFDTDDPKATAIMRMILNIEKTMLQIGEFESDYAYIIAKPA